MLELKCKRCSATYTQEDLFCSRCGKKTKGSNLAAVLVLTLVLAAISIYGISFTQTALLGKKPSKVVKKVKQELLDLQNQIQAAGSDLTKLVEIREKLKKLYNDDKRDDLTFTLITILNQIIKIDPNERQTILDLAELSFERKIFDQASAYYKRYLDLDPQDLLVKGRYASSLSFEGKFKEALAELDKILSIEPNNFHALAFSSITYFQIGDFEKAQLFGTRAIQYAPNEEAKQKLASFLKKDDSTDPITSYLRNNQITANKFVKLEEQGDSLNLEFKDFPMHLMPEVAKESFTNKLKELSKQKINIKLIKIIDSDSGNIIYTITLK